MHSNQNQEKSEEFIELRHSIENRIEELEDFFEDNFDNEFIFYFERGRYKLKKLLMYEPNLIDEINNGKNMKAFIFGQKSQVSQSTPDILIGQDTDVDVTKFSNNNFMNKNNTKSYQISENNVFQTKNNQYNLGNRTNVSNTTNRKNIINYFNKNKMPTSYSNTNTKSNKNFMVSNTKRNYNGFINQNKQNLIRNNNKNRTNEFKNKYYNNYYNKDIRKKLENSSDEDTDEIKEKKLKYLDWTENNTLQGNTLSNQSNTINNNNNTNNSKNKKNKNNKNIQNKKNRRDTILNVDSQNQKNNNLILNKNKNNNNNFELKNKINKNPNYNDNNSKREDLVENNNNNINIIKINYFDSRSDKEKSLSEISSNRRDEQEDSMLTENKEQYKEILFQIKLTKEEYHLLQREKTKIINPLK